VRAFLNGYRPRSAGDRADRAVRAHPEQPRTIIPDPMGSRNASD
jgi:hypothetical protein